MFSKHIFIVKNIFSVSLHSRLTPGLSSVKRTWSTPERSAAKMIFASQLEEGRNSTQMEIGVAVRECKELKRRSIPQIKMWLQNQRLRRTESMWNTPRRHSCEKLFRKFIQTDETSYPNPQEILDVIEENEELASFTPRHVTKSCKGMPTSSSKGMTYRSRAVSEGIHSDASDVMENYVFPSFREGIIKESIRYDDMLIVYGNVMTAKYRNQHHHPLIRNRLIRMAKQCGIHLDKLSKKFEKLSWMELSGAVLLRLLIFNRRRPGELETALLTDLDTLISMNRDTLLNHNFNDAEQKRAEVYSRFVVRGKLARGTPSRFLQDSLGFSFESQKRGRYSVEYGASDTELLRATTLRKHIASNSASLKMKSEELEQLQGYLGHADKIHREYYREPIAERDIINMGRVLLAAQPQTT
ncbi:hypothetical protein JTB14_021997 [Gonioctena quinquepunctata]|nr:hypothetical protein JTB14_021997 [Gonioctena quinquepunctata]